MKKRILLVSIIAIFAFAFNVNAANTFKEENGHKYCINENGEIQVGAQVVNGKTYFFSRANNIYGQMKYGWQDNGINKFYLDEKTGELYTGLFTYMNNKYYANDQGFILVGQQTIDGKTYFFSRAENTFGQMKYGMQDDGINKFYLDETSGELIKGQFEYKNDKYYANDQGYIQGGFVTIEGKKYFYSRAKGNNFGKLKYGWSNAPEGYWYQDTEGVLVTGNQHVDARDYVFSKEGFVQGFKIENGKKYYYDPDGTKVKGVQRMCGTYMMFNSLTGVYEKNVNQKRVIDISVHNGNVDWEKVKESGLVDGVILRSSFGVGYIDGKFERNVKELNRLGIPYSVYHFSYAENKNEAKKEADYLISVLKKYPVRINSNMFSIYYDLEDWEIKSTGENSYGIKPNTYKEMITTFASTVQNATGIKVRVYASKNYIETRFPKEVQGYATWVAQWSDYITYKGPYEGWQYTSKGKIPGINGNVDMSIFYY